MHRAAGWEMQLKIWRLRGHHRSVTVLMRMRICQASNAARLPRHRLDMSKSMHGAKALARMSQRLGYSISRRTSPISLGARILSGLRKIDTHRARGVLRTSEFGSATPIITQSATKIRHIPSRLYVRAKRWQLHILKLHIRGGIVGGSLNA